MLTDREIATLVIVGAVLVYLMGSPKLRPSLGTVLKAFFGSRLLGLVLVYLAYAAAWVTFAYWVHAWTLTLLKDTIVVVITLAIPMLFRAISAKSGDEIFKHAAKETIGVGALVLFYVNLTSFTWPIELVIQVLLILATMVSVFAKHQGGDALRVAKVMDGFNLLVGLAMLIYTTIWLIENAATLDWWELLLIFLMTIWLPAVMLPFVYGMAYYAGLELLFVALPFFRERKRVPLRVRLAIIAGMGESVNRVRGFTGHWRQATRDLTGWRDTLTLVARYRAGLEPFDAVT